MARRSSRYRPLEPDPTLPQYREWLYAWAALYEREALKMTDPKLQHIHRMLAESRRTLAHLLGEHSLNKIIENHDLNLGNVWGLILGLEIAPLKRGPLPDVSSGRYNIKDDCL